MKSVYIVEDQTILSDLLKEVLKTYAELEIVGACGDGRSAYREYLTLEPDIVILDLMLPGMSGIQVLQKMKTHNPLVRVLIFSAIFTPGVVRQVVEAEADGYVQKTSGLDELRRAIEALIRGETFFSPAVVKVLSQIIADPSPAESLGTLTDREREVLYLVAESHSSKEIAKILELSVKTVQNHRSNLMKKLDVHNVAGLMNFAMNVGLTKPPSNL